MSNKSVWVVYRGGVVGDGPKPERAVLIRTFYNFGLAMKFINEQAALGKFYWINREEAV